MNQLKQQLISENKEIFNTIINQEDLLQAMATSHHGFNESKSIVDPILILEEQFLINSYAIAMIGKIESK